ncbi:MAG: hypothetical protein P1V51_02650 [Deltaproteobacteria bacterium]|nr:hypothetical protein [Deltaproteobacteria bacterium]
MNLRDRAWRNQLAKMVERLDALIDSDIEDDRRLQIIVLRDRLAGALGADEGFSTTAELRERARRDYEEALGVFGESGKLELPEGGSPKDIKVRKMAGFAPARPRHGDRA